jgi:hypothetical protein
MFASSLGALQPKIILATTDCTRVQLIARRMGILVQNGDQFWRRRY